MLKSRKSKDDAGGVETIAVAVGSTSKPTTKKKGKDYPNRVIVFPWMRLWFEETTSRLRQRMRNWT